MRRAVVLVVLVAAALAYVGGAVEARAAGDIRVISSGARVDFPGGVTFALEAEAAEEITEISLQVNTPTQRYGAFPRNVRPDFRPGSRVSATWTWRRFGGALPPGTEISYRWRMAAASGSVVETPAASVRVEDSRFQWRELRDGAMTVRWHQGNDDFGHEVLAAAASAVAELGREQGVDLQTPVTVHVYASQNELFGALPGVPAWVGGISLGEFDTLLVPIATNGLAEGRKALAHELAHQLIYQITFNTALGSRVPAWLNEGLAVVAEGATSPTNRRLLDDAVANDALPTLRSLGGGGFSSLTDHRQAGLAYAAAESVVRHLLASEGPDRMRALLAQFREGRTADDALRQVYGRGVDQTEDRWRLSLGLRPLDRGQAADSAGASGGAPAPAQAGRGRGVDRVVLGGIVAIGLALLGALGAGWWLVRRT